MNPLQHETMLIMMPQVLCKMAAPFWKPLGQALKKLPSQKTRPAGWKELKDVYEAHPLQTVGAGVGAGLVGVKVLRSLFGNNKRQSELVTPQGIVRTR